MDLTKFKFYCKSVQYQLTVLGYVGLLLLFGVCILFVSQNLAKVKQLKELNIQHVKLIESHQDKKDNPVESNHDFLFYKEFPKASEKDVMLRRIIEIADQYHLALDAGKYSVTARQSDDLVTNEMRFPLKDTYPNIKQFLAEVLNTMPNAAISQLEIQRSAIDSNHIEAEVTFLLYFNKDDQSAH